MIDAMNTPSSRPSGWFRAPQSVGGVEFEHPTAFWLGVTAVTAGVLGHIPMYANASSMHYRLRGMSPDAPMLIGMALILVGLAAVCHGLGVFALKHRKASNAGSSPLAVAPLDETGLRGAHVALLLVMAVAITIDAMKPMTLGFVVPGVAHEYGLKSPAHPAGSVPVALLPLFGLAGTLIGSFLWGRLGDSIGRRASILLAGVVFIATSICGAMPSFDWNLFMCFMMGVGVGGMLPITVTLIAELLPRRHRGWAMVLIGGELAAAYVLTSQLATSLIPTYSWRIMWFLGLPTGVILIALQRFIPESPRFLLLRRREDEARAVLARYGARVVPADASAPPAAVSDAAPVARRAGGAGQWSGILLPLALGAGLVTYGFQLWVPSILVKLGFSDLTSASFLRDSAVIGLPVTIGAAFLYAVWSTRGTILLLMLATIAALAGFAIAGDSIASHRALLHVLLAVPVATINSVLAVVLAYAAEIHSTGVRSTASGVTAGLTKAGGVLLTALVAASVAPPSMRDFALIGLIPVVVGTVAFLVLGVETRSQPLERIGIATLKRAGSAAP
jgi:putative MFS transporter